MHLSLLTASNVIVKHMSTDALQNAMINWSRNLLKVEDIPFWYKEVHMIKRFEYQMTVWEHKARSPYNRPDRPDRPDHPKRLKERDDHMEKLPGRSHKSFGNLFLNWETNFRFDTREFRK